MWSDQAKDRTLICAFDAGYGIRGDESSIGLVFEPEAAAIYTITSVVEGSSPYIISGDGFARWQIVLLISTMSS